MKRPSIDLIRAMIIYAPLTGSFTWAHHDNVYINVKGKAAGTTGSRGHRKIAFQGYQLKAHHVAWAITYGYWPIEVDHKDNNRANNKLDNLREATRAQNQMNRVLSKNNTSGYKGVIKRKYGGFEAKILVEKRYIHIGKYPTAVEAAEAYDKAALEHHKDFAKTNKMLELIP